MNLHRPTTTHAASTPKGKVLDGTGTGGLTMNVKSDAMWVGTKSKRTNDMIATEGDVTRLRLVLEGERRFAIVGGAVFVPSGEVGLRFDGGDAETGAGVEVGAGLRYTIGSVTMEAQARTLVAHEAAGYEEWGLGGAIRVAAKPSGRGFTNPVHCPGLGAHRERRGAPVVGTRRNRSRVRLSVRGRQPAHDRRRLRLRVAGQPRRAHALRRHDARRWREPHSAHRHPLAVGPRCSGRTRGNATNERHRRCRQ